MTIKLGQDDLITQQQLDNVIGDLSTLPTTNKESAVGAITELFQSASNGKQLLATAITGKGISASANDSFSTLASKVNQIKQGTNFPITYKNQTVNINKQYGPFVTNSDSDITETFSVCSFKNVIPNFSKVAYISDITVEYSLDGGSMRQMSNYKAIFPQALIVANDTGISQQLPSGKIAGVDDQYSSPYLYLYLEMSGNSVTMDAREINWGSSRSIMINFKSAVVSYVD